jgi:hypothetical protein
MNYRIGTLILRRHILGKELRYNPNPNISKTLKKPTVFKNIAEFLDEEDLFQLYYCCSRFKSLISSDMQLENKVLKVSVRKLKKSKRKQKRKYFYRKKEKDLKSMTNYNIESMYNKVKKNAYYIMQLEKRNTEVENKLKSIDDIIYNPEIKTSIDIDAFFKNEAIKERSKDLRVAEISKESALTCLELSSINKNENMFNSLSSKYF